MTTQQSPANLPEQFSSQMAHVNGVNLHYVTGGQGSPVILLHGYPQTWCEWRAMLPALAQTHSVVAPDLRGSGDSDAPESGYDKRTLAEDVYQLIRQLGWEQVNVVGHDVGSLVAYTLAAEHPEVVAKLVLLDAPIPDASFYSLPAITPLGPGAWQFGFFSVKEIPEGLIAGREVWFLRTFMRQFAFKKERLTDADIEIYARPYSDPAHLHGGFEYFRTFPQDIARTQAYAQTKLTMPILALGGQYSVGERLLNQARQYGADGRGGVVEDCGHWIPEEQPEALVQKLLAFFEST